MLKNKKSIAIIVLAASGFISSSAFAQDAALSANQPAMGSAATNKDASGAGKGVSAAEKRTSKVDTIPMVILVPANERPDPTLYNGCWVRLIDNVAKPAGNEYLTIVGKMYLPSLTTATGVTWSGKSDALSIGPNALVTVYGQQAYMGPGVMLKPNQIVQDARADLGFINSVESMTVECRS